MLNLKFEAHVLNTLHLFSGTSKAMSSSTSLNNSQLMGHGGKAISEQDKMKVCDRELEDLRRHLVELRRKTNFAWWSGEAYRERELSEELKMLRPYLEMAESSDGLG